MKRLEDQLQEQVAAYLRLQYPQLLWFHVPNSIVASGDKAKRARTINRFKKMGLRPGVADIILFWRSGIEMRGGAIELKIGKNQLQPSQKTFRNDWTDCVGHYAICRNLDEVIWHLKAWGIPRGLI